MHQSLGPQVATELLKPLVRSLVEASRLGAESTVGVLTRCDHWDLCPAPHRHLVTAVHGLAPATSAVRAVGAAGWGVASSDADPTETPAFTAVVSTGRTTLALLVIPGRLIWTPEPEGRIAEALRNHMAAPITPTGELSYGARPL